MPLYEFLCDPCRTVFTFFARRVDTTSRPPCPRCGRPLSRNVTAPAYLQGGGDGGEDGLGDLRLDEDRMERAMAAMGDEIDKAGDSDDPKAAAAAMESFSKASGLTFNRDIRDAIHRMAEGADPDAVGAEIDAMMENGGSPFVSDDDSGRRSAAPSTPYRRDPTLYDLPAGTEGDGSRAPTP